MVFDGCNLFSDVVCVRFDGRPCYLLCLNVFWMVLCKCVVSGCMTESLDVIALHCGHTAFRSTAESLTACRTANYV